ncbi:MAG TPA: AmmeMemoRadiSam system protein A [Chromatiales bacterium]|nr:AmmeMemoRadiSam system protein A [Chromatiales bacterium]
MSSGDRQLSPAHRRLLLQVARDSIAHGLRTGRPLPVDPADFDPELQAQRATFVTLEEGGQLRGCIGHLEAIQPLVADVAENAFNAAFRDPRFPPVRAGEFDALEIHISVLSPPEPMAFDSEGDLLRQIRPGVDGLILEEGVYKGTFLPSVWEQLPDPRQFLAQLKMKAGLPPNYWSDTLKVSRYTTESFAETA